MRKSMNSQLQVFWSEKGCIPLGPSLPLEAHARHLPTAVSPSSCHEGGGNLRPQLITKIQVSERFTSCEHQQFSAGEAPGPFQGVLLQGY